jgi:fumarate reductase subunit D
MQQAQRSGECPFLLLLLLLLPLPTFPSFHRLAHRMRITLIHP